MRSTIRGMAILSLLPAVAVSIARADSTCRVRDVVYNGWACKELSNGQIDVVVAPQLGGRIIQLRLGETEYLWVNPELAGKVMPDGVIPPAADSKTPPAWANYGGDKLWPAPQGWAGPNEWPGPPDPYTKGGIVDHGPYKVEPLKTGSNEAGLRLTSPIDTYAGLRFIRDILITSGSTTVHLRTAMINASDRPIEWGIWQVTQHGGHTRVKDKPIAWDLARADVQAWSPLNPKSRYPQGYKVMFGPDDNPQFGAIPAQAGAATPRLFRLDYQFRVGKVGIDNAAGWIAITHAKSGHLFAHLFAPEAQKEHPDGASVEFWASGPGKIRTGDQEVELDQNQPLLIESEILSPRVRLVPGTQYTFSSTIHLSRGVGPVLSVTREYAELDPIRRTDDGGLAGKIAVFKDGMLHVAESMLSSRFHELAKVTAGEVYDLSQLSKEANIRLSAPKPDAGKPSLSIVTQTRQAEKPRTRSEPQPPSGKAVHISTAKEFETLVLKATKPALVDFYADWCGPCRRLAPIIEQIAKELAGKALVYKVDVDNLESVARKYGIESIPHIIVFSDGKPARQLVGFRPKQDYLSAVTEVINAK